MSRMTRANRDTSQSGSVDDGTDHIPGETLHRLVHSYRRAMREAMTEADMPLTISHKRVVKWLAKFPGMTAHQIADESGQDKGRITRLLKELEAEDLIERLPHPEDRRSQTLHLTASGEKMMETIRIVEQNVRARMSRGMTPRQIRDFVVLANLMADNLDTRPNNAEQPPE